jgi:hypothetical protein
MVVQVAMLRRHGPVRGNDGSSGMENGMIVCVRAVVRVLMLMLDNDLVGSSSGERLDRVEQDHPPASELHVGAVPHHRVKEISPEHQ